MSVTENKLLVKVFILYNIKYFTGKHIFLLCSISMSDFERRKLPFSCLRFHFNLSKMLGCDRGKVMNIYVKFISCINSSAKLKS